MQLLVSILLFSATSVLSKTVETRSRGNCSTTIYSTADGDICGSILTTHTGTSFKSFQGIPFAAPPVGDLRFMKPQPVEPWTGVLDASAQRTEFCAQPDYLDVDKTNGQEDCLYLNVYVPEVDPPSEALPVMVWIFGGGFTYGSGTWDEYGPEMFMDTRKVVMVTFNYRVGPLGWMTLNRDSVAGNQGLEDMISALNWVQTNIDQFGGDPDQVTIFGESAGSWGSSYLNVSPLAKGLFSRVIQQSGEWTHPGWRTLTIDEALDIGRYSAEALDCETEDDVVTCLQSKSVRDLLDLMKDYYVNPPAAVIDGLVIPKLPHDLVAEGEVNAQQVIVGANEEEGLLTTNIFLSDPAEYEDYQQNWEYLGPMALLGRRSSDWKNDITEQDVTDATKIMEHYIGSLDNFNSQHFQNITNMMTDQYWYSSHTYAQMLAATGTTVYQYLFTYRGENGFLNDLGLDSSMFGPCHADELYLMWNPYWFNNYTLNKRDSEMGRKMVQSWVDFACTGDPAPPGGAFSSWTPVSDEEHEYLEIDDESEMTVSQEYTDRVNFWTGIMADRPLP